MTMHSSTIIIILYLLIGEKYGEHKKKILDNSFANKNTTWL